MTKRHQSTVQIGKPPLKEPNRRRWVVGILIAFGVITPAAIAHVWTHLQVLDYGYRLSKATRQHHRLTERQKQLEVEIALLRDPQRIAKLARQKLNLRAPQPEQMRRIIVPGDRPLVKRQRKTKQKLGTRVGDSSWTFSLNEAEAASFSNEH
jgi:cell division protein FtsL